jgi:hypothetical protein
MLATSETSRAKDMRAESKELAKGEIVGGEVLEEAGSEDDGCCRPVVGMSGTLAS